VKPGPLRIRETGIVLSVKNYEKCVRFYSEKMGFPIRFQKPYLTNFDFGGAYLLIEKGNFKRALRNGLLRVNVPDVPRAVRTLRQRGVRVRFRSYDWGDIGQTQDPEGNLIEFCRWK
jgi:lactoylglutathione lyase